MKYIPLLFVVSILSCTPTPKQIEYGMETCKYCKMTIVDQRYASQLVSDKGRNFTFDAIECMVNFMDENNETSWSYILVSDFENPGSLINAHQAVFLKSENLPSPMGANLNAFSKMEIADSFRKEYKGNIYEWNHIKTLN